MSDALMEEMSCSDGLDSLRKQLPILTQMLSDLKKNSNKSFSGFTFQYAARFFYQLGQTATAIQLLDKAINFFGEDHPFCVDCRNEILEYSNAKLNLPHNVIDGSEIIRIWIFNTEGIDLFSYNPYPEMDPIIFGGFFSAIRSLCKNLNEDRELSTLIVQDRVYNIIPKEDMKLTLIALIPSIIPPANVDRCLNGIINAFYEMYQHDLQHFVGKTSTFRNFTPDILPLYEGLLEGDQEILE